MKQCPKGHIYDEKRNGECPYCGGSNVGFQPLGGDFQPEFPKTMPVTGAADEAAFPPTMPIDSAPNPFAGGGNSSGGMSVTVALDQTESGINPVRGWLVAVDGEKAGTSFVIHGEQNSIGRGSKFDVNLAFDKAVSSDGNAVIAYDGKNRKFFLSPVLGKGKNNVYHNDTMLLMPAELADYDKIQFGTTTYVFRSFCNESFTY
ncbi:MAG: FHA domain-containing protein [Ruminococcus sp.]|nr:FHA domain-containing protein [Ruminococcus sp.]MCM1380439.1 FHA domain-containing protein [Muribaculaceae bacterium]MCM1478409.1 FHA domain-containing protein [Muribaculaceae bacterium]